MSPIHGPMSFKTAGFHQKYPVFSYTNIFSNSCRLIAENSAALCKYTRIRLPMKRSIVLGTSAANLEMRAYCYNQENFGNLK